PSFWGAPFLFYDHLDTHTNMLLFGARPDDCTLVPGDIVPESLLRGLKALADPTRLRILRSLNKVPQTPTQLAHILRLRAPTVIHHLRALRLAGLVQVTVSSQGERNYATRFESFGNTQDKLQIFINGD
ncbi:MAG: winged helix-turn-helix domain-containing protein, partial [Chloroflexota bacterium]